MPSLRTLIAAAGGIALLGWTAALAPGASNGSFTVHCGFSHRLSDDPIVFPHQHGASHSHDFFGNSSTDANSTLATMQAAQTTCNPRQDRSGYWIPTLYKYGRPVTAVGDTVYYRSGGQDPASVQPLPDG